MSVCYKLFLTLSIVIPILFYLFINDKLFPHPELDSIIPEKKWFGPGEPTRKPEFIRPFKVSVPERVLQDLKLQLQRDADHLAKPVEGTNFNYGFNTDYLKDLLSYWENKYDWRAAEKRINDLGNYKTTIDGLDIHFVHVKPNPQESANKVVVPLLIAHGWPGSFLEFEKMIPRLTKPQPSLDFVFEIVAPSMPGYAFSDAAAKEGMNFLHVARMYKELMQRLGHNTFYTQGGDWGSSVTMAMAVMYPETVLGYHTNFPSFPTLGSMIKSHLAAMLPALFSIPEEETFMIENLGFELKNLLIESGYLHQQATKPDTIGVSLTTSPSGLAAWILEKFAGSTNRDMSGRDKFDGGLNVFDRDELLTNLMLYWINGAGASAARFYLENIGRSDSNTMKTRSLPVQVPTGVAIFPHEINTRPRCILESKLPNMLSYTVMSSGGHFAAMQEPELLAQDIFQFVRLVRGGEYEKEDASRKEL